MINELEDITNSDKVINDTEYENKKIKTLKFEKLTPTKCDNMECYNEALDFVFNQDDLLNITITGPYSGGKSSVIKTYEDLNKDKNFIHISLAYFQQVEDGDNEKDNGDTKEDFNEMQLEGKIINQLIHKIDPEKVQQTWFKVKSKIPKQRVWKNFILISLFTILMMYIFKFNQWTKIIKFGNFMKYFLYFTTRSEVFVISIFICISIFLYYLYQIIKMQLQKPIFKKVKWKNNEIEIFENSEESYFDKYLDEIIYLLRNSDIDAIVFEDIDRYNNNIIFGKLREINILSNNPKGEKYIRFFYLLRDDIFTSKDRTKFFDFMIPIVPVVDSSNSYDQMLIHFKNGGIIKNFDKSFLERLSLYIDDMRILKNIYNEYLIYRSRIQSIELIDDKLLAIIVYKNIFPKDFSELQLNSGFVHNVFINKDIFIEDCRKEIDLKIENNLLKIESIKNEQLNDLDELDAVYLRCEYLYRVNGKNENDFKSRAEYVKEMKKKGAVIEYYSLYNGQYFTYNIQPEFDRIHKMKDYTERKKIIEQKMNNGISRVEKENDILKNKKNKLYSKKLCEFDNINEIFTYNILDKDKKITKFKDVINNKYCPLIKYLIRNGYIDETYFDYLAYFYENSLTREDKIFLRSITDEISKPHNYKLKNIATVVSRLKDSDFKHEEILNFYLLNYLLDHEHSYCRLLLNYIKEHQRFDFVWNYILQASDIKKFIKMQNQIWTNIWGYLLSNEKITESQKKQYIIYTFYYSSIEEIENMNGSKGMTSYISSKADFLHIDEPKVDSIINGFIALDVKFDYIDYEKSNKDLFKEVYKNNLYKLNFSMIQLILEKVYNIKKSDDFKKKNYTLICSKEDEPLKFYINNEINTYIEVMLENSNGNIIDSEDSILDILNNEDIKDDYKMLYIKKLSNTISKLSSIEEKDKFWEELLENNVVKYSSYNTLIYYFDYSGKIDSILTNYLNGNPETIFFNYSEIKEEFNGKDISKFFHDVMKNKDLINEKYRMILKGYKHILNEFEYIDISDDKFKILIQVGIIGMTKENIQFIRENYYDLKLFFFCSDIENYIYCLEEDIINEEEILELLNIQDISDDNKINLVKKVTNSISLIDCNYSYAVKSFIMNNNFDINDLEYIVENYEKGSPIIKKETEKLCVKNIETICYNEQKVNYELLYKIVSSDEIDEVQKKEIIYYNLDSLNAVKTKECMCAAGLADFAYLFDGRRPKILVTEENLNLLNYFKEKNWINSFREDYKDSQYYRVIGKKIN